MKDLHVFFKTATSKGIASKGIARKIETHIGKYPKVNQNYGAVLAQFQKCGASCTKNGASCTKPAPPTQNCTKLHHKF